jgi:iron complex outermembrane receptor protein
VKSNSKSFLLLCFISLQLSADDLVSSIFTDMQQFDEIATQTKQNEHYQPYIISVFQSKELEKLGVCNLKEALMFRFQGSDD